MSTLEQQVRKVLDDLDSGIGVGNGGTAVLANRVRQLEEELSALRGSLLRLAEVKERAATDGASLPARSGADVLFSAPVTTAELRSAVNNTAEPVSEDAAEAVIRDAMESDPSLQGQHGKPLSAADADWLAGVAMNALASHGFIVTKPRSEEV